MKKEIIEVELNKIKPNPFQPRKFFDEEKLKDLALSMEALQDTVQPITVRKVKDVYEIKCGERRYRAAERLKWKKIWVVCEEAVSNGNMMVGALAENLNREDLTDIEKAEQLKKIAEEEGIIHKEEEMKARTSGSLKGQINISELAKRVGLTPGRITQIFDSADIKTVLVTKTVKLGVTEEQIAKLGQSTVNETKVLPEEDRIKVLVKAVKVDKTDDSRTLGCRNMRKLVNVVKKTKEGDPLREALLSDEKILAEDGEKLVEAELSPNQQISAIEEIKEDAESSVEYIIGKVKGEAAKKPGEKKEKKEEFGDFLNETKKLVDKITERIKLVSNFEEFFPDYVEELKSLANSFRYLEHYINKLGGKNADSKSKKRLLSKTN